MNELFIPFSNFLETFLFLHGFDVLVNKFAHAQFTTKIGIHSCLENLYWFTNYSMNVFFPRCYQVRH